MKLKDICDKGIIDDIRATLLLKSYSCSHLCSVIKSKETFLCHETMPIALTFYASRHESGIDYQDNKLLPMNDVVLSICYLQCGRTCTPLRCAVPLLEGHHGSITPDYLICS